MSDQRWRWTVRAACAALSLAVAQQAFAACPIELAVYSDRDDVAGIDFRPTGEQAAVVNSFRMALRDGPVFEGHVMWTEEPGRSYGQILHQCPEGDLTGEEITACTVWQGSIYAVGADGSVGLMPAQGEPAPERLLLADFSYQMRWSSAWETAGLKALPWDEFKLSGCQE